MSVPAAGLPAVNQALEPAWVRHGSSATQKAYDSALAFEETLVDQLSQSLSAAAGFGEASSHEGEGGGEGGESEGTPAALSDMVPQALAQGIMSAGGLGLAAQLTRQDASAPAAGGVGGDGGTAS